MAEEAWEAAGDHGQTVLSKLDSSVALRRMTVSLGDELQQKQRQHNALRHSVGLERLR